MKTQFVCTRFGRLALVAALLLCVGAATALAQEPADGAKVFNSLCVNCHKDGSPTQAPLPEVLRKMPADTILAALTDGKMKAIASRLTDGERLAVAKFLGTAEHRRDAANRLLLLAHVSDEECPQLDGLRHRLDELALSIG